MIPSVPSVDMARRWAFGIVEFDEGALLLWRDGEPVEIEPTPLKVMRLLLDHAGDVVTKDALLAIVWPGRIVSDSAVAKSVSRLRCAIGDHQQRVIRTHHRIGYRLTGPVRCLPQRRPLPEAEDA